MQNYRMYKVNNSEKCIFENYICDLTVNKAINNDNASKVQMTLETKQQGTYSYYFRDPTKQVLQLHIAILPDFIWAKNMGQKYGPKIFKSGENEKKYTGNES